MRREQRLRRPGEFSAVYRKGRAYRREHLVLRARRTDLETSRFGFTVGKAIGNAVVRNRVKRRLREAVRSLRTTEGWDVVVNVRRGTERLSYSELRAELGELMEQAGVLRE